MDDDQPSTTAFVSYPPTGFTFPNDRQTTNVYDILYRRTLVEETSGGADIAAWEFFGAGRVVELVMGNGLIMSHLNNARTRSATAGMTVSALRWAVIDTLHHHTGLKRPEWDDSLLPTHLSAFDAVVDWHYRHYQFYANMAIALPLLFIDQWLSKPYPHLAVVAMFIILEILFVATSRDTLRKYYARTTRLLGTLPRADWSRNMANGSHPPKSSPSPKPTTDSKKPSNSRK